MSAGSGDCDLALLFQPRSIAVVGAHDQRPALSHNTQLVMRKAASIGAAFYPINPKVESVHGVPTLATVGEVPGDIDLLVILTSDPVSVLRSAAGKKVRFVLVFANGYSELGTQEGRQRERDLLDAAQAAGARLVGPNTNTNSLALLADLPGPRLSLVSQSGHQGSQILQAQEMGIGVRYLAPTGNECDLEASDFLRFFAQDAQTAAICAYVEGFVNGQKLREAAVASLDNDTPVVVVKVGRTQAGASMAASHTGHLAGSDRAHQAFFEQYGMNRVDDLDELLEVAVALSRSSVPAADGVLIASVSGGTASQLTDLAVEHGLSVPELSEDTQQQLRELVPPGFTISNPLDTGGPATAGPNGSKILQVALADPSIGILIMPVTAAVPILTDGICRSLLETRPVTDKPIICVWAGPTTTHPAYQQILDAGIPIVRNFRNAVTAARALLNQPARRPELREVARLARELPPIKHREGTVETLDERASAAWLSERGIPYPETIPADSPESAVSAAQKLGFPVVVKGVGLAHKTEAGVVRLNLANAESVRSAARDVLARGSASLIVAPYLTGGVELLAGISHDPVLGPLITVGAGGVTAEAADDVVVSVLPLTEGRIRASLERLRISPLLRGWRGAPAVDVDAVVRVVLRLAAIAADGEAEEVDINPLLAMPDGAIGLDALVRLRRPASDEHVAHVI